MNRELIEKIKSDLDKIIVYGSLPFVVLIDDGFNERGITIPGKDINVMNYNYDIQASLYFKKEKNNNSYPYFPLPPSFEDLNGQITYSNFCFITGKEYENSKRFFAKVVNSTGDNLDDRAVASLVAEFVNKFISVYRIKTNKHWMGLQSYIRLSPYQMIFVLNDGTRYTHNVDFRGTGILTDRNIEDDVLKEIKESCFNDIVIDNSLQFLVESNRYKQNRDFRSFVLYLAFYIESWISREINYVLESLGKKEDFIAAFYKRANGQSKVINEILNSFMGQREFVRLTGSIEYIDYRNHLAERRNSLAHGRFIDITYEEAEEIVRKTMKYRDMLQLDFLTQDIYKNANP